MRLVLVEWVDAVYHDLWEAEDDTDPADMTVRSVGWLLRDTPEYKQVVPHRQADQVRGGISIPAIAIKKMTDLSAPRLSN